MSGPKAKLANLVFFRRSNLARLGVGLCALILVLAVSGSVSAQPAEHIPTLELGRSIERSLVGGQADSYQVNIPANQIVYLLVEQKGIDVVVKLFAPDGSQVIEVDSPNGDQGLEPVHLIIEAAGVYRLEVSSLENSAPRGRYEAKLVELKPATPANRDSFAAERAYDEAIRRYNLVPRELPEVAEKYEEALALYRRAGDRRGQFDTLNDLGAVYRYMGDFPRALTLIEEAAQVATALNDIGSQASASENTGTIYRAMGEFDQALRISEETLRLYQAAGNASREAFTLQGIGELYSYLGEQEKAREYYARVIRLYQALGNKKAEAAVLRSISVSYNYDDNWPESLNYARQSLALSQQLDNPQEEALAHSYVGLEYARSGARAAAIEHATEALRLRQPLGNTGEATILTNVGNLYGKLGEYEKAEGAFTDALRIWRATGEKRGESIALRHYATTLRSQGRLDEARTSIQAAITLLEFMRDHAGTPEAQQSLIASLFDFYEIYIDVLMRLHAADPRARHDLTALAFSEKVKVRSLKDLLTTGRVELETKADPALLNREREANELVTARLDQLTRLLRGTFSEGEKNAATKRLELAEAAHRQVQAEIRHSNPRYSALVEPQPLSVTEIQSQTVDANTLMLEYSLGADSSYLWAVTPLGVQSFKLPPKSEIEAQAVRVYQLLIARQPVRSLTAAQQRDRELSADRQFPIEAEKLSQMLLGPVASQLGTKRLLIVGDGALQYLPFSILPRPPIPGVVDAATPQPLIVDHEVVDLPSASVLSVLRNEFTGRKPAPRSVAVLADPVYQLNDSRVRPGLVPPLRSAPPAEGAKPAAANSLTSTNGLTARTRDGLELNRLLFSRDEAQAIISTASDRTGLLALDFRANRQLATSGELDQYRILHFSSHGLLDSRRPELSGLVLSLIDEKGQPEEGFLRLHEIYNLRLNAELVVLSACQTALGKDVRGEGLIGLTRGFMYAGVPRVVASLWEVDDAATTELMKRFYRGLLQQKLPSAAALRAAQIEMLQKKHWQSPYYWGAFVLQGEWK